MSDYDAHGLVRNLLSRLPFPDALPAPEVIVDEDGDLSFDWDLGSSVIVSVSLSPTGNVAWTALIGEWRMAGQFHLPDEWPPEFNEAMTRLGKAHGG